MTEFRTLRALTKRSEDSEVALAGFFDRTGRITIVSGLVVSLEGAAGTTDSDDEVKYATGTRLRIGSTVYTVTSRGSNDRAVVTPASTVGVTQTWEVEETARAPLSVVAPRGISYFPTTALSDYRNHVRISDSEANARRSGLHRGTYEGNVYLALRSGEYFIDEGPGFLELVSGNRSDQVIGPPVANGRVLATVKASDRITMSISGHGTDHLVLSSPDVRVGNEEDGRLFLSFFATVVSRPSGLTSIAVNEITSLIVETVDPEDGLLVRRDGATVTESLKEALYSEIAEELFRWLKGRAATRSTNADDDTVWTYDDGITVTLTRPPAGGAVFTARKNTTVLGVKRISATGNLSYTES